MPHPTLHGGEAPVEPLVQLRLQLFQLRLLGVQAVRLLRAPGHLGEEEQEENQEEEHEEQEEEQEEEDEE